MLAHIEFLERHIEKARTEFSLYKYYQDVASPDCRCKLSHFVFDYAEKMLLPRLQKQPGQLAFIKGLKFDLFGVACSNDQQTDFFGLVECYGAQEITANTVT